MASTTLTLPATMASPAAALSFCSAHVAILALDLGTTTGYAIAGVDGGIASGTAEFQLDRWQSGGMRFLRFKRWLTEIKHQAGGLSSAGEKPRARIAAITAALSAFDLSAAQRYVAVCR